MDYNYNIRDDAHAFNLKEQMVASEPTNKDAMAEADLVIHKLPPIFSYRQAWILGYNYHKAQTYKLLYGGK